MVDYIKVCKKEKETLVEMVERKSSLFRRIAMYFSLMVLDIKISFKGFVVGAYRDMRDSIKFKWSKISKRMSNYLVVEAFGTYNRETDMVRGGAKLLNSNAQRSFHRVPKEQQGNVSYTRTYSSHDGVAIPIPDLDVNPRELLDLDEAEWQSKWDRGYANEAAKINPIEVEGELQGVGTNDKTYLRETINLIELQKLMKEAKKSLVN